ncbi:hypothetical protein ACKKBG_A35590 [Auxenochlorella protothecoides x Auxenochlorella symbiontica]
MSVRNIERAFNALHSQQNEEAALADPAQARVQQAQTEADRLRSLSTSMTTADVIERILLHYAERDYFRLLELPAPEADVLGNVTWQGTALEVSKAYRRLSVLVHPDKNPGEDARKAFEALNEAHRVLKDADKRDTLLKEHLDAALGRRWGREARATLEERVALNAAQAQEAAALRKQEGEDFRANILEQLKQKQERMALKRQRASQSRRRAMSDDGDTLQPEAVESPSNDRGAPLDGDSDDEDARRRRQALARRKKTSTFL